VRKCRAFRRRAPALTFMYDSYMAKIFKKLVIGIVLLLAAALLSAAAGLAWYKGASQPQVEGNLRLEGLKAPVDVVRDAEGIPHIYASSAEDAYFAIGFLHAQDRLWQLELNRRIPAGTMAEILGPGAADTDRFLRTL